MSVEQITGEDDGFRWLRSSYSGSGGGNCVEVAADAGTVHVRDSKDALGPMLSVPTGQWSAFVAYAVERVR